MLWPPLAATLVVHCPAGPTAPRGHRAPAGPLPGAAAERPEVEAQGAAALTVPSRATLFALPRPRRLGPPVPWPTAQRESFALRGTRAAGPYRDPGGAGIAAPRIEPRERRAPGQAERAVSSDAREHAAGGERKTRWPDGGGSSAPRKKADGPAAPTPHPLGCYRPSPRR